MTSIPSALLRPAVLALLLAIVAIGCGPTSSTSGPAGQRSATSSPEPGSTGPSGTATPAGGTRTWVGTVEGTDAYIAILADADGRAFAYLCDGEQLVQYLDGRVESGTLTADDGEGTTITATVTDGAVSGRATLADGTAHAVEAPAATGEAGMWWLDEELEDGLRVGGWIRAADGTWRGRSGDVVIAGRKIDGTAGSGGGGRTTTTSTPSGTVLIDGCPVSTKGPSDVPIKGNKIDDGSGSGDVAIDGGKIADETQTTATRAVAANQPPPPNATRTTNVDDVRCALIFKPELSIIIKGGKVRQN